MNYPGDIWTIIVPYLDDQSVWNFIDEYDILKNDIIKLPGKKIMKRKELIEKIVEFDAKKKELEKYSFANAIMETIKKYYDAEVKVYTPLELEIWMRNTDKTTFFMYYDKGGSYNRDVYDRSIDQNERIVAYNISLYPHITPLLAKLENLKRLRCLSIYYDSILETFKQIKILEIHELVGNPICMKGEYFKEMPNLEIVRMDFRNKDLEDTIKKNPNITLQIVDAL